KNLEVYFVAEPSVPTGLIGDPLRLSQILINLTNNAVKFTSEGEVLVRVTTVKRTNEDVELRFTVTDTGIGMNAEQRERLFKPFMQADTSTTRKFGGTGLGLSIVKHLVDAFG